MDKDETERAESYDEAVARAKNEVYENALEFATFISDEDLYASNEIGDALRAILNLPQSTGSLAARFKGAEIDGYARLIGEAVHAALIANNLRKLLSARVESYAQAKAERAERISAPLVSTGTLAEDMRSGKFFGMPQAVKS